MRSIPPIQKGLGQLTPVVWAKFAAAAEAHGNPGPSPGPLLRFSRVFIARITDATEVTEGVPRWRYNWTEVQLTASEDTIKTSGRSGTAGYNLVEWVNTAEYAGPGWTIDGETVQPIADDQLVIMYSGRNSTGGRLYVFAQDNPVECPDDPDDRSDPGDIDLDLGSVVSPSRDIELDLGSVA